MKILKYKQFNEIKIEDLEPINLETLKFNLLNRLKEYRTYILENIYIEDNKVKYKNFQNIDIESILNQLNAEFTKEFIDQLNILSFLRRIKSIMIMKRLTIKKDIRTAFTEYQNILDRLFKNEYNF
ncbi:MAG: hypothetical protein M0R46_06620 [Candidatus Muirbacterium halophilum]|nr:hypothetical protein [Candidatus Muirbacterium halophilum]